MYMWHLLFHWYAVRYCRCRPKVGAVWVWCRCKVHGDEVGLRVAVNAVFLGHFISFLIPLLCLRAQMEKTIKHHTFTPWWEKKTSWLDFCTNNRPQQKKPWRHNFPVASNVLLHNTLHEVGMFTRIWTFFWLEHSRSWANIYTFGWWTDCLKAGSDWTKWKPYTVPSQWVLAMFTNAKCCNSRFTWPRYHRVAPSCHTPVWKWQGSPLHVLFKSWICGPSSYATIHFALTRSAVTSDRVLSSATVAMTRHWCQVQQGCLTRPHGAGDHIQR